MSKEIAQCPVLYPSSEQFSNFEEFVQKLDQSYKSEYGMVKEQFAQIQNIATQIVPPVGWKPASFNAQKNLENVTIKTPIQQNVQFRKNAYQSIYIVQQPLTFQKFKSKAQETDNKMAHKSTEDAQIKFWKTVAYEPPLYGADIKLTLMDEQAGSWNLNNLNSVLKHGVHDQLIGVNTTYCYIGSWKAFFAWHKEDLDLSAINFLHQGKSKFWYSIQNLEGLYLENEAKYIFPQKYSKCRQFLRHKNTIINPYTLKKKYPNLKLCKIQQKPNEFIIVFGGSYHCGFNLGFNVAQAVNYGTKDWLRQIFNAEVCNCSKSSVNVSKQYIYQNLLKSKIKDSSQFLEFKRVLFSEAQILQQSQVVEQTPQCQKKQDNFEQILMKTKLPIKAKKIFKNKNINKKKQKKQKDWRPSFCRQKSINTPRIMTRLKRKNEDEK